MTPWRVAALAAVVYLAVDPSSASAQTVVVTGAPAGTAVELVVNGVVAAKSASDPQGTATLIAPRTDQPAPAFEAQVSVDECGDLRRVHIVDRNAVAPDVGGCVRTPIDGVYRIQPITSLLVQLGGSVPSLRLRQGALPEDWLAGATADVPTTRPRVVPGGLNLFGGGGISTFRDFAALACGSASDCSSSDTPGVLTGGVTLWFHQFIGVEASYIRPGVLTADGSGQDFRFASEMEPVIATISAKAGLPLGGWRFVGSFGLNYHQSLLTTTQTIDERTITVDDAQEILPGGSQTFSARVSGWGWQFAGGGEYWFTRYFGLYGEGGRLRIKGDDPDGSETRVNETANYIVLGARIGVPTF